MGKRQTRLSEEVGSVLGKYIETFGVADDIMQRLSESTSIQGSLFEVIDICNTVLIEHRENSPRTTSPTFQRDCVVHAAKTEAYQTLIGRVQHLQKIMKGDEQPPEEENY